MDDPFLGVEEKEDQVEEAKTTAMAASKDKSPVTVKAEPGRAGEEASETSKPRQKPTKAPRKKSKPSSKRKNRKRKGRSWNDDSDSGGETTSLSETESDPEENERAEDGPDNPATPVDVGPASGYKGLQSILLENERFMVPEVLFRPMDIGKHRRALL